jgi:hypothetical protein
MGIHHIGGQLDSPAGVPLGLVPLLLIELTLGIIGQGQRICGVKQVGAAGSGLSLCQVGFAIVTTNQVGRGSPVEHENVAGGNGAIVAAELDAFFKRSLRYRSMNNKAQS